MYMLFFFFFNDPATPEIYTLSLHDALPILPLPRLPRAAGGERARVPGATSGQRRAIRRLAPGARGRPRRSEEHTSELQSRPHLVCRLLLEKKKIFEGTAFLCKTFQNCIRSS